MKIMGGDQNPYVLVHEKLSILSAQIKDLFRNPDDRTHLEKILGQILDASRRAGGKLHEDVEKLAGAIRLYLQHPSDPHLVQQVLDGILQIRQDATEI